MKASLHADEGASPRGLDLMQLLRCPWGKQELASRGEGFFCSPYQKQYPVVLGIPDLRLCPDPLIGLESDYRKGEKLQKQAEALSFEELVRYYWTLPTDPPNPPDLTARFIRHILTDEKRIKGYEDKLGRGATFLHVGRGTGAPENAIEKRQVVSNAHAVVAECARVLEPEGRLFAWTTNRFSLAPEPHVRVWGVGFLPRRWMPAYVKWRRGLAYQKKNLPSIFEVRRVFEQGGSHSPAFSLPPITAADMEGPSGAERLAARVFRFASRTWLLRWLLLVVSPVIQVVATRRRINSR